MQNKDALPKEISDVISEIRAVTFEGRKTLDFGAFSVDVSRNEDRMLALDNVKAVWPKADESVNAAQTAAIMPAALNTVNAVRSEGYHTPLPDPSFPFTGLTIGEACKSIEALANLNINRHARDRRATDARVEVQADSASMAL